ncbi:oligosaccharide flippase family protein [Chryseobacterium luquanense]|uniref:Oligosaccharide flippase family protein n=1 Tax=Chryseobacterium luquanense TaxID=2983766 RepID=A0ABT3Y8J5_9FLAO|nr:oligosaccharide flippase family protein [Chryseobacterium luquanense]MCX8534506.1 oligosaccharide flippase family protein [Chryseobacterium luquanense]
MKAFIQDFIAKKGIWVGSSLLISRLSAFLLTIFVARILTKEDFGVVTFGLNFLTIFLAFSGFGASQGVLRFGSVIKDEKSKTILFRYAFSYGLIYNCVLTGIMFSAALLLYWNEISKIELIALFSIRFLGIYLVEQKKAEYRAQHDNQSFAKLDIFLSVAALILGVVMTHFSGMKGFIASLCLAPFFLFFYDFKLNFSLKKHQFKDFTTKEFWRFSWTTALTTQIGELVFILDIFFIGLLMGDHDVANYKVSSMIPMNILVLGFIFMQTEYPKLCQHHKDRKYQYHFIFNYWKLFAILSIVILGIGFFFENEILSIFGSQYKNTEIYRILLGGAVASLLFRVLFVYMLASIGKPIWNLVISVFMLLLTSVSLYVIIPQYGLIGVSYVTLGCLSLSGILPMFAYFYESKKL